MSEWLINQEEAEALWAGLNEAFANLELKIKQIIATRAWEPIGHETFHEAWAERMAWCPLATSEMRARVVYCMFDEGLSVTDVAVALEGNDGIGPATIANIKREKDAGYSAEQSRGTKPRERKKRELEEGEVLVSEHIRSPRGPIKSVHVDLGEDEYKRYKIIAKKIGRPMAEIAAEAIRERFAVIGG